MLVILELYQLFLVAARQYARLMDYTYGRCLQEVFSNTYVGYLVSSIRQLAILFSCQICAPSWCYLYWLHKPYLFGFFEHCLSHWSFASHGLPNWIQANSHNYIFNPSNIKPSHSPSKHAPDNLYGRWAAAPDIPVCARPALLVRFYLLPFWHLIS